MEIKVVKIFEYGDFLLVILVHVVHIRLKFQIKCFKPHTIFFPSFISCKKLTKACTPFNAERILRTMIGRPKV